MIPPPPSGIPPGARLNGLNVIATHNQSFEGIRQEYLSASRKYREGTFSLSFGAVYNSDPLLGTDVNGDSVGTFGYYDLVTTAAFGFRAAPKLDLGVGVEYLNSKIGDFSGSGFALNLGGRWFPGLANLSLGASVRHLGPGLTLENRKSSLPTTVQGGLSYIVPLRTGDLVLAGEVARTRGDSRTHLLLGGEYSQRGLLSLLAGYRSNYDSEAFSFGVGLTLSSVQVHYTYLPFKNDLGSSSRIALSYSPRP